MATYVNNLRLKEIATGDESGTWGTSTNTNLELIGEAFDMDFKDKNYINLTITSRDVSKKSFKHYLLKEIYETKDIVESTLRRYIAI